MGAFSGYGYYTWRDGRTYRGHFENGKRNGKVIETNGKSATNLSYHKLNLNRVPRLRLTATVTSGVGWTTCLTVGEHSIGTMAPPSKVEWTMVSPRVRYRQAKDIPEFILLLFFIVWYCRESILSGAMGPSSSVSIGRSASKTPRLWKNTYIKIYLKK